MRKGIALFCTVFILLSSGYAQSNRVGLFVAPQGDFLGTLVKGWKLDLSRKEKGLILGEGIYYERCGDLSAFTIGLGYTQIKNKYTSDLRVGEGKKQLDFVSIILSGTTNFYDGDQFKVGALYGARILYLLKVNEDGLKTDFTGRKAYERLAMTLEVGVNFTYLFTDNIGISAVVPLVSFFGRSTVEEPSVYWGFGGQIRFFYAFGY